MRRGDHVYVIGDELRHLAEFSFTRPGPGTLRRVLPDEDAQGKPDLEALTVLPPTKADRFGTLLGLGSGSAEGRDRGFAWALGPDGALEGEPRTIDLAPLYDRLRGELGSLDVEGACVMDDRLWVLHRGDAPGGESAIAELPLDAVEDARFGAAELLGLRGYRLGELDGVRLTFSDATPLGYGQLVFTAQVRQPSFTRAVNVGRVMPVATSRTRSRAQSGSGSSASGRWRCSFTPPLPAALPTCTSAASKATDPDEVSARIRRRTASSPPNE